MIFQDWKINNGNLKARFVLVSFRLAQFFRNSPNPIFLCSIPYLIYYRIFIEWILGIELPWNLNVGRDLRIYHGQALVINDGVRIGERCILRQSTTIGHKGCESDGFTSSPIIGNDVDIGANVVIIGNVIIGNNVTIGAGSVVVKSLESNGVYAGNPAKLLIKKTVKNPLI